MIRKSSISGKEYSQMHITNEEVLNAWLKLSTAIHNGRMPLEMPFNELLICGILYRNQTGKETVKLTATDLCAETKMLKSQMNRTLNSLEKKGLILRTRSETDRRQVYINFQMDKADIYEREHERILVFVDRLLDKAGREHAEDIVRLFTLISNIAGEVIQ